MLNIATGKLTNMYVYYILLETRFYTRLPIKVFKTFLFYNNTLNNITTVHITELQSC